MCFIRNIFSLMCYVFTVFIYFFLLHTVFLVQFSIFVYLSEAQLCPPSIVLEVTSYLISDSYLPRYHKFLLLAETSLVTSYNTNISHDNLYLWYLAVIK